MNEIKYPTEVEAAFLVVSDMPQDFLDYISKLKSLGRFELRPEKKELIRDRYFDTPKNALQDRRMALRIREVVGRRLMTLKGPSRSLPSGGVERLEIEEEWSDAVFRKVLEVLKSNNIDIGYPVQAVDDEDPIALMGRHHLYLVQERETERDVKNVMHKIGDGHIVVAEMAIDAVRYLFDDIGSPLRIYQIEIEVKDRGSPSIMRELADELENKFRSDIIKWNYGKLATGKAIKKLLGKCDPKKIADSEGNLKPDAYDWIENYIRKNDKRNIE
jgi:SepF-like predicted cell division protein (DUF552 family)